MTASDYSEVFLPGIMDKVTMDLLKQTLVTDPGCPPPASPSSETSPKNIMVARPGAESKSSEGSDCETDVKRVDGQPSGDEPELAAPAAREAAVATVEQRTGADAEAALEIAAGEAGDEQRPNGDVIKPGDGASGDGAIARDEAHAATKAMLMRMMAAGAPYARKLALAASAGRAVLPYNPISPVIQLLQPAPVDAIWREFEVVRLSLCSAETRHEYLNPKNQVVQLGNVHFSGADEITESSRTALLLYDVDENALLGVWKAVKNEKGSIQWRVVRHLAMMGEAAFRASAAGAIFPELPPMDTSAQARGEDARLVLRVLAEYSASATPPQGAVTAAAVEAKQEKLVQQPAQPAQPAGAEAHATPALEAPATTVEEPVAEQPEPETPAQAQPASSTPVQERPGATAPPAAAPTALGPAAGPTIQFGEFEMHVTADASLGKAEPASTVAGVTALPAGAMLDRQPLQLSPSWPLAAIRPPGPTAPAAVSNPAAVGVPVVAAAPVASAVAGPLVPPRVVPPGTGYVPMARAISSPSSGTVPPPLCPVYLPPVLMLQRHLRAAGPAAPAAGAPTAVALAGIHGTAAANAGAGASASAAPAPGPTVPVQVQITAHAPPAVPPPATQPPVVAPVSVSAPLPMPIMSQPGLGPPPQQLLPQAQPDPHPQPVLQPPQVPQPPQASQPASQPRPVHQPASAPHPPQASPAPQSRSAPAPQQAPQAPQPASAPQPRPQAPQSRSAPASGQAAAASAPVPLARPAGSGVPPPAGPNLQKSFLAAARAAAVPPPAQAAAAAAGPSRPAAPQAAGRPAQQQQPPAAAPPPTQPVSRPAGQQQRMHQQQGGQSARSGPTAAQVAGSSRPAGPQPAAPAPFPTAGAQSPVWPAMSGAAQPPLPPPLIPTPPPAPAEPPAEAPASRPVTALSCPLCLERSGCWFLLVCKHMGPCEECCPTPEDVQTRYSACVRCGTHVAANQVLKARVS